MGSVQRGGMIKKNDNGTLERIGKTGTFVGSATLPSGEIVTKRFRSPSRDFDEVVGRWLKWQSKNQETLEKETDMTEKRVFNKGTEKNAEHAEKKGSKCPFNGGECGHGCQLYSDTHARCSFYLMGSGVFSVASSLMTLDHSEELELIAMALADLKESRRAPAQAEPKPAGDGAAQYLEDKTFISFVNLHSKSVYSPYKKFCGENGYEAVSQADFTKVVRERFPELKEQKSRGGCVFVAA